MRYEELTIEGRNAVLEAYRAGKTIDKLFVLDGCQDGPVRTIVREAKKHDTIVNFVAKERLDQISETGKHQGVIAYAAAYEYAEVEDLLKLAEEKGEPPFLILLDGIDETGEISQQARDQVNELLKRSFRPEFLNRLDEIVFYKPLTKDNVTHIIDLMAADINRRLEDKQLTVELTPAAKDYIIESAYDPIYGARPLRRFLQHTVETLVSKKIIADQAEPGSRITVDCRDGELTVDTKEVLTGEVIDG